MSLEKIIKEKARQVSYSKLKVDEQNAATAKAREALKRSSKGRLEDLLDQYVLEVRPTISTILIVGDLAHDLQEVLATEAFGIPKTRHDDIYEIIASQVQLKRMGGKAASKTVLDIIRRIVEQEANKLNVTSYPLIQYTSSLASSINSQADVLKLTKKAIQGAMGSDLSSVYLTDQISKLAFESDFDGKIFPATVLVSDEKDLDSLKDSLDTLGVRSFVLVAGKLSTKLGTKATAQVGDITEENVVKALTKIRSKMKQ